MGERLIDNIEHWPRHELSRLENLRNKYQINGFVIISGDVHHAQFLKKQL